MILRPGGVTLSQLEAVLGEVEVDPAIMTAFHTDITPKSPGMKYKHYSPKAKVIIIQGDTSRIPAKVIQLYNKYTSEGYSVGILATEQTRANYLNDNVISIGDRNNPETIASSLFFAFREFDDRGIQIILAEAVENTGIGLAIMNRMNKAAGYNIVQAD